MLYSAYINGQNPSTEPPNTVTNGVEYSDQWRKEIRVPLPLIGKVLLLLRRFLDIFIGFLLSEPWKIFDVNKYNSFDVCL